MDSCLLVACSGRGVMCEWGVHVYRRLCLCVVYVFMLMCGYIFVLVWGCILVHLWGCLPVCKGASRECVCVGVPMCRDVFLWGSVHV